MRGLKRSIISIILLTYAPSVLATRHPALFVEKPITGFHGVVCKTVAELERFIVLSFKEGRAAADRRYGLTCPYREGLRYFRFISGKIMGDTYVKFYAVDVRGEILIAWTMNDPKKIPPPSSRSRIQ